MDPEHCPCAAVQPRRPVPDLAAVPAALDSSPRARARPAVPSPVSVPVAPGPASPDAPRSRGPCTPPIPSRRGPTTRPGSACPLAASSASAGGGLTSLAVEQSEAEPQAQAQRRAPLHLRPPRAGRTSAARLGLRLWELGAGGAGRGGAPGAGPGASGRPPHLSVPPPAEGAPVRRTACGLRASATRLVRAHPAGQRPPSSRRGRSGGRRRQVPRQPFFVR